MTNCLFCKIVNGEIPYHKVYEDEHTLAFLDINPTTKGHTLVIPKKHAKDMEDISSEELSFVVESVKKVSSIVKEKLGADGFNIMQANGAEAEQSVFHIHFHIVPRYAPMEFKFWPEHKYEGNLDDVLKEIKN